MAKPKANAVQKLDMTFPLRPGSITDAPFQLDAAAAPQVFQLFLATCVRVVVSGDNEDQLGRGRPSVRATRSGPVGFAFCLNRLFLG